MSELEPIDQNALAEPEKDPQRNVASVDACPKEGAFAISTDEASIQRARDAQAADATAAPVVRSVEAPVGFAKEAPADERKPMRYYIDFENVRGAGLKGIDMLSAGDEVFVFYSQAAETFHIEQAIDILKSEARVEFVEIDSGTPNALDFQLVTALFGTADPAFDYAIVSGDGGFDAAIKMGKRLGLPSVVRLANVQGDLPANNGSKSKSRTRRSRAKSKAAAEALDGADVVQDASAAEADTAQAVSVAIAEAEPESASGLEAGARDCETESGAEQSVVAPYAGAKLGKPRRRGSRGSRGSGKSGKREKIAALLADGAIELDQQQLSTVMQALNGVKSKQQLYRNFVKLEGRDKGGVLYHQVKTHYDALVDIVRQQ